jgi:uncharacterized protein (TIGR00730 family)
LIFRDRIFFLVIDHSMSATPSESTLLKSPKVRVSVDEILDDDEYANRLEDRALLGGPNSRRRDLQLLFSVMGDFMRGFRALHFVGPCITVFGSARYKEDHPYYKLAQEMGAAIAKMGFTVLTGGGPGIMEAANRGASEVGALSVALNIALPHEQNPNAYVTPGLSFKFHYFALRKMHFMMRAKALVAFPGGFGTLDELFEVVTLVQTRKSKPVPILLFGSDYWHRLLDLDMLLEEGMISAQDLNLLQYVDTPEAAWQAICAFYQLKVS